MRLRDLLEALEAGTGTDGSAQAPQAPGGFINWSFLQAGLVDELSLVIAPLADGENDTVTLFEKSDYLPASAPVEFALKSVEKGKGDSIWLRYSVKNKR